MAKNLQSVLNSVVNDLLQESYMPGGPDQDAGAALAQVRGAKALKDLETLKDLQKAPLKPTPGYMPGGPDNSDEALLAQQRGRMAKYYAGADVADELSDPTYLERMKGMAGQAGDWLYANRYPVGLGAAALAAGAGALYLRKKQREANKAAGR